MKKAISMALVLCAVLSLCACGGINDLHIDIDFDLNETLDKYENVVNEYLELLERLKNDPTDEVLKEEYASFVAEYGDVLRKLGIDIDAELSDDFIRSVKDVYSTLYGRVEKLFSDIMPK